VCIATTGLSNSIGWKFGEYVALSQAIVGEKLHVQTFSDLKNEINYHEFNSVEECASQGKRLQNKEIRLEMKGANSDYFHNFYVQINLF